MASVRDPEDNVWVWDFSRRLLIRVTTDAALELQPVWSPDDRWIVFSSNRGGGVQNLWRQSSDGTGMPERLTNTSSEQSSPELTRDGTRVLFTQRSPTGEDRSLMELHLDTKEVRSLSQSPLLDGGRLSPDGRWLAYHSSRSGRLEVYVQPYPEVAAGRWQLSFAGGQLPLWARDGSEIFFLAPDGSLMGSKVRTAAGAWSSDPPVKLQEPGYWGRLIGRNFDVSPDGTRFLVVIPPENTGDQPELIVVQHWDEEVRSRVPAK